MYTAAVKKRTPLVQVGCLIAVSLLFVLGSCETVAATGRSRLKIWTDPEQESALGLDAYNQILSESKVVTSGAQHAMILRIGQKIAAAAEARAAQEEWDPQHFDWDFNLIDSETINAFCLPGGKVAFYTGILAVAQNEDAIAGIMGHEIAHATLRHGGERMTQNILAQGGMTAAALGLSLGGLDEATSTNVMGAIGAGIQYGGLLPYSREHESEADLVGLRYMIEAGYDPNEVPKLWERMAALSSERPSEFMSTHPDPLKRAETIRQAIPQMMREAGRLKQVQR